MRLFIAAEVPEEMREALAETSARLRGSVRGRFVAPDSFHVTLAFLGEVAGSRADDAGAALARACHGFAAFDASLGELGCFGKRGKATLWQGFRDAGALPDLAKAVRGELRSGGFAFDGKAFLPHVTLMRVADLTTGALPAPLQATGRIASAVLFRSDLSGERPVYEPLLSIGLE